MAQAGKGANEAFDLFCYAHAVAVLRGYEKIRTGKNRRHGRSCRI
jgi:phage terminase large subunit GpA-like protein